MKKIMFLATLLMVTSRVFSQTSLLSYDDIQFMLQNNLEKNDTFLVAKGYVSLNAKPKKGSKKFILTLPNNVHNNIELRVDGRKIYIDIQTNALQQYDMLKNSIASYKVASEAGPDTEAYRVKDLGNIYVLITDAVPYNPLKREYEIQIAPDKQYTALN